MSIKKIDSLYKYIWWRDSQHTQVPVKLSHIVDTQPQADTFHNCSQDPCTDIHQIGVSNKNLSTTTLCKPSTHTETHIESETFKL